MSDVSYSENEFDEAPAILIFSDSISGENAARDAVDVIGGRIAFCGAIGDISARLKQQVAMAAILIDITRDHGHVLDRALDQLDALARHEGVAIIVSAPLALIDTVSARLGEGDAIILCDPDPNNRVAALSLVLSEKVMMFADVTTEIDSQRLRRLADEVSRIARALSLISSNSIATGMSGQVNDVQLAFKAEPMALEFAPDVPSAPDIRRLIRLRRQRDNFFDAALFADPAWDMLLDLMAARIEQDRVAVSSLCIAASVPPTTALRWIKAMTDHGLFERHADPDDGRRIFIRLSEAAAAAMGRYFTAAKKSGGWVI